MGGGAVAPAAPPALAHVVGGSLRLGQPVMAKLMMLAMAPATH